MSLTTISLLPNLDITAIPTTVSQSQLAIDATVGSTLGTYRVPLSSIRDFVLNSSSTAYNVTGLTTDTSHIAMGVPTGTNIGIGTTAPEQKLHVVGGIYSTQSITALSGFVGNADTATALQNSCTIKTIGAITSPTYTFTGNGQTISIDTTLTNSSIGSDQLATDSVITDKILDFNVTGDKIANTTITTGKLQDGCITNAKIEDYSGGSTGITSAKIIDDAITSA